MHRKKEDSLPYLILLFPPLSLHCPTTTENCRPSTIYFIVYNILCVYIYIYSNSGNYSWDCRLSSVNRVIYKASVRPPQVITSVGPELVFLSAQQHATGTSGISFIGSFLLTFFADPVYKNVQIVFNRVNPKCIFMLRYKIYIKNSGVWKGGGGWVIIQSQKCQMLFLLFQDLINLTV